MSSCHGLSLPSITFEASDRGAVQRNRTSAGKSSLATVHTVRLAKKYGAKRCAGARKKGLAFQRGLSALLVWLRKRRLANQPGSRLGLQEKRYGFGLESQCSSSRQRGVVFRQHSGVAEKILYRSRYDIQATGRHFLSARPAIKDAPDFSVG